MKQTGPERQPSLFAGVVAQPGGEAPVSPGAPAALSHAVRGNTVAVVPDSSPASPPAPHWYLTADLRAATGLTRTAMDFYLRAGVVRPAARTESGYLLFDANELALLRRVLDWRARGISLRDIRAYLGRETTADTSTTADTASGTRNMKGELP